jgi:acyl-CoA reductase-like NAD-dependent aldehyde dehydrogenase
MPPLQARGGGFSALPIPPQVMDLMEEAMESPASALAALLATALALRLAWYLLVGGGGVGNVPELSVPLEGNENEKSCSLEGPSFPDMPLSIPSRPGFIQCYDPSTCKRLGEVKAMSSADVEEVVRRSRVAQREWCKTSFGERRRVLQCIQKYVLTHQDEIVRICARDSGKPMVDAMLGEVLTTVEKNRCMMAEGEGWLKRQYRPVGPLMVHKTAYVEYHPLGVLGVIAPWNYPFHNVLNHVASGIFSGNAVVTKVSEYTSWSSRYFGAIISAALSACGHNPDLCAIVTGFGEVGAALVACDGVDKIIFTGSPEVGKKVMAGAAPHLKPVVLELGGKDPFVVCDDAKVAEIMPMAMRGVFQNCGQNCCGIERMFVYESVYEELLDTALREVKKLRQGPPLGEKAVDCGAMVMPGQLKIIQDLVDDAVAKGARLLTGGKRNASLPDGLFYEPTILADITADMEISRKEVFGPVMCVMKVPGNSDSAAIAMVNDSRFGLGSSVFSGSRERAARLGRALTCGMTTINDFGTVYLVQALPFGGVKDSGFGRFAGPEGLRACCLEKSVVEDRISFIKTTIPSLLQYPIAPSGLPFTQCMVSLVYGPSFGARLRALVGMVRAGLS